MLQPLALLTAPAPEYVDNKFQLPLDSIFLFWLIKRIGEAVVTLERPKIECTFGFARFQLIKRDINYSVPHNLKVR